MPPQPADLPSIERGLWQAATRFDPALMERTFALDFVEFGRSGRLYTRDDMLTAPNEAQDVDAILHDIAVRLLSDDLALVTYVSEVRYPKGTEWSNRSSIWDRSSGAWQVSAP